MESSTQTLAWPINANSAVPRRSVWATRSMLLAKARACQRPEWKDEGSNGQGAILANSACASL
jgi:hypothetical protein